MDVEDATGTRDEAAILACPPGTGDIQAALTQALESRRIDDAVAHIVRRLRGADYSVDDLLRDVACAKDRTDRPHDNGDAANWLLLDAVLTQCLAITAAVHEAAIETMAHGFCEIDADGRVTFANPMLEKLLPGLEGARLASFFGDKASAIEEALTNDGGNDLLQLRVETPKGSRPVLIEIGRVANRASSFAIVTDLAQAETGEQRILSEMPVAMLKLDEAGIIRAANGAALKLLHQSREAIIDRPVTDLLGTPESRAVLAAEMRKRTTGQGSRYELDYCPPGQAHVSRLGIVAMPVSGYGGQAVVGTLAMLTSLDDDLAARDMFEIVARESEPQALFGQVMERLRPLVPFERAYLTIYSADRVFTRSVAVYPDGGDSGTRWFQLSAGLQAMIGGRETWGNLRAEWAADESDAALQSDPGVRTMVAQGMRSFGLLRLFEGRVLRGGLTLLSREFDAYGARTIKRLVRMGMIDAMNAALMLEDARERTFEQDLLKAMAPLRDGEALAAVVCDRLVAFHGWQSVGVYRVNVLQRQFELIAQSESAKDGIVYPDSYTQPIELGLLGRTFASGAPVKMRARDDGSEEARVYIDVASDINSEICLPVRLGPEMVWILCVDDRRRYAFEGPDEAILQRVVGLLESGLERVLRNEMLNQVLDVVPDGVVLVDPDGIVLRCNDKAREMLGPGIVGAPLADRIVDPTARDSLPFPANTSRQTDILDDQGHARTVTMRHFTHRNAYNHRVVVFEDVNARQADLVLGRVDQMLSDAFAHVDPSLNMLSSYLNQIVRGAEGAGLDPLAGMARKALEQLGTLKVGYADVLDRLEPPAMAESA